MEIALVAGRASSDRRNSSEAKASPAEAVRLHRVRIHVPIVVSALIGVVLSLLASLFVWHWEQRIAQQEFTAIAENQFIVLQERLNEYLSKLLALRALFDSSDDPVKRHEFESFVRPVLQSSSGVQTLSWVPRVLRGERAAHELAAAQEGLPGYRIKAAASDGSMVPSGEQDEYFPIFYATFPKTSPLYGLDLRSEPPTLAELEHARDGNKLGFSEIPALVSAGGRQHGFIFSLPVYRKGSPHETLDDRRRNLVGFVHGSFVTAKVIETILSTAQTPQGVNLYFFRPRTAPGELPLYSFGLPRPAAPLEPAARALLETKLHWSRELIAGNEPWLSLIVVPSLGGPLSGHYERALGVLLASLIVTALMVLYIRSSVRHAKRLLRANEAISALALRDVLTGLFNRRAFNEQLAKLCAACRRAPRPFVVLYFDLDDFKDVNDTLGHPIGDLLLKQVAERVQGAVRGEDIVARFGGDEFAILQVAADESSATQLATRINNLLAQPFIVEGNEVHVTASIGIALCNDQSTTPDGLIMQADLALYRAKEDGRNCFRYHSPKFDLEIQERVMIAEDLRGAAGRGELRLYYQPQVELSSGRIVGVEGLLRWQHPQRGLLQPSIFIQIAERTGSIIALGEWTFDEACHQLRWWADMGISPGVVAVNVSASQFRSSFNLEDFILKTLRNQCITPSAMEIEMTESVLMEVSGQHHQCLERLRQIGVRIAVDDFGTGYSSLNYLTNYPISRLKIAQELVFGVIKNPRNATVVRAVIRLAGELGIECIAEGIETMEQAKFLIGAGCNYGQGYYFSKPLTADHMTVLLQQGTMKLWRAKPQLELVAG